MLDSTGIAPVVRDVNPEVQGPVMVMAISFRAFFCSPAGLKHLD